MIPKVKQFKDAMERYGGNLSKVAEAFKVSRTAVYQWIRSVPEFKQIMDDARMRLFDECLSTARIAANGIPDVQGGKIVGWIERPLAVERLKSTFFCCFAWERFYGTLGFAALAFVAASPLAALMACT